MRRALATSILAAFAVAVCAVPTARADLIINGGFETTSALPPPLYPNGTAGFPSRGGLGMPGYNLSVTGWSNPQAGFDSQTGYNEKGYNFIFASPSVHTVAGLNGGTVNNSGSPGYNGNLSLWGPNSGSNNGLTASPVGGKFLGADGDPQYRGPIEQTVNGLTPGQTYELGFWWGGVQQYGFGGLNTEQWIVTFGNQTQSTPVLNNVDLGFTGWRYQTLNFTPTSSTQLLSFLANGTPGGGPPFVLLDGVSLNAVVPEPSTMLLLTAGLVGLGVARRRRVAAGV